MIFPRQMYLGILLICLAATFHGARAGDWYVSPSGSDGASGGFGAPFQTILKAVQSAGGGDTIRLLEGEHTITPDGTVPYGHIALTFIAEPITANVTIVSNTAAFVSLDALPAVFDHINFVAEGEDLFWQVGGTPGSQTTFTYCNFVLNNARIAYMAAAYWKMDHCHVTGTTSVGANYDSFLVSVDADTVIVTNTVFEKGRCNYIAGTRCLAAVSHGHSTSITMTDVVFNDLGTTLSSPLWIYNATGVVLTRVTVKDCLSNGIGGVILDTVTAQILDSTFEGNYAKDTAAALEIYSSTVTIKNTIFKDNLHSLADVDDGQTVRSFDTILSMEGCTFDGNIGGMFGADLFVDHNISVSGYPSDITLKNSSFINHNVYGALVQIQIAIRNVDLQDLVVTNNTYLYAFIRFADLAGTGTKQLRNLWVYGNTYYSKYQGVIAMFNSTMHFYNLDLEYFDGFHSPVYDRAILVNVESRAYFEAQAFGTVLPSIQIQSSSQADFLVPAQVAALNLFAAGNNILNLHGVNLTLTGQGPSLIASTVVDTTQTGQAWIINDGSLIACCRSSAQPITFNRVNLLNRAYASWENPSTTFTQANIYSQAVDPTQRSLFEVPLFGSPVTIAVPTFYNRGTLVVTSLQINGNLIFDGNCELIKPWSNYYAPEALRVSGDVSLTNLALHIDLVYMQVVYRQPEYLQTFDVITCDGANCALEDIGQVDQEFGPRYFPSATLCSPGIRFNYIQWCYSFANQPTQTIRDNEFPNPELPTLPTLLTLLAALGSGFPVVTLGWFNNMKQLKVQVRTFGPKTLEYDNTATKLRANYPRDTDLGSDGNCAAIIAAESLVLFDQPTMACTWIDRKTLQITSKRMPNPLNPAHTVTFLNGSSAALNNPAFKTARSTHRPLIKTSSIPAVKVILVAPQSIPSCGDVLLDATASTGGGAFGLSYMWTISRFGVGGVDPQLQAQVDSATGSTITIASNLLQLTGSYGIGVLATNIFNRTDYNLVLVARSEAVVPPVILDGPTTRSHFSSLPLLLITRITLSDCLLNANISISLAWTQTGGPTVAASDLIGTTTPTLYIPEQVLLPDTTYKFKLTATAVSHSESSALEVTVNTYPSPQLALRPTGDGTQSALSPVAISLSLIDPRQPSAPAVSASSFSWAVLTCPGGKPFTGSSGSDTNNAIAGATISDTGDVTLNSTTGGSNVTYDCLYADTAYGQGWNLGLPLRTGNSLTASVGILEPGAYSFAVTAVTADGRRAETVVFLNLRANADPPIPSARIVLDSIGGAKPLPTQSLQFDALVDGVSVLDPRNSSNTIGVEWAILSGGIDMDDPTVLSNNKNCLPLVMNQGVIVSGRSYILQLSAWYIATPNERAIHTVPFTANSNPSGGYITVSPTTGTATVTPFTISASNWNDEDIPIRYEFALVVDGRETLLSSRSEAAQLNNLTLNAWSVSSSAQVLVRIFDIWGGVTSATTTITLNAPATSQFSLPDGYSYFNASDVQNLNQFIDSVIATLVANPGMSQQSRADLIALAVAPLRVSTADAIQRLLAHLVSLNKNGADLPSDLLDLISLKSAQALDQLFANSLLTGFSSKSADEVKNTLAALELVCSITWNHNNSPYTSLTTKQAVDIALGLIDKLTILQTTNTQLTSAPAEVSNPLRPLFLALLSSRESTLYLDAQNQSATVNPKGSVMLPIGFGSHIRSALSKKRSIVSQDEVSTQLLQWSSNSFPYAFQAESQGTLHSTVISFSVIDTAGDKVAVSSLPLPVEVQFDAVIGGANHTCVWWDAANGHWSPEGCGIVFVDDVSFKCLCTHLTDFGLLFSTSGGGTIAPTPVPQGSSFIPGDAPQTPAQASNPNTSPDGSSFVDPDQPSGGVIAAAVIVPIIALGAIGAAVFVYLRRTGRFQAEVKGVKDFLSSHKKTMQSEPAKDSRTDTVEMSPAGPEQRNASWQATNKTDLRLTNV